MVVMNVSFELVLDWLPLFRLSLTSPVDRL